MMLKEIIQMDKTYYMNTFGERTPVSFTHGEGSVLYDSNGKAYIDFLAGIAVNSLGYGHPKLTQAIVSQASKLIHCSNLFYIEAQAKLAKLLADNSCGDKVFFCNSGAEANEGAIKLARKYFNRQGLHKYEIISAQNSFHGRTLATIAATGQEKYQKPFEPMPKGFLHIPFGNLASAEQAITENTAAILVEVIQGEGGVIEGTMDYIQGLQGLCRKNGLLLIIDEVQTGIGRTGKLFGYEHYGIEPDIFTLAKGLGGGIPIGAIVAKGAAAEAFEPGNHGTTFGGNPLACSAGLAVMETVLEEGFLSGIEAKGKLFKDGLMMLKNNFEFITDVRGKGLILGLELKERVNGKEIVQKALAKGFVINCAGHNTLRFVPPLVIQAEEIQQLLSALSDIFTEVAGSKVTSQEKIKSQLPV
jgi:acetylornithine aminotransferase/acetylornithine/N-succinyldiaminopimelate aminotransferase